MTQEASNRKTVSRAPYLAGFLCLGIAGLNACATNEAPPPTISDAWLCAIGPTKEISLNIYPAEWPEVANNLKSAFRARGLSIEEKTPRPRRPQVWISISQIESSSHIAGAPGVADIWWYERYAGYSRDGNYCGIVIEYTSSKKNCILSAYVSFDFSNVVESSFFADQCVTAILTEKAYAID